MTTLQNTLSGLLNQVLGLLGNLPLLKLDGAQVGVATKASDTLANSLSNVTATLGKLTVLGVPLPGVDLASTGTESGPLAAVAAVLAIVALGIRRTLRR
ncbi:MAG: hypothetical protein LC713_05680 [Actinobacteria bacterium]|nr:hypothetical protein [Actinomycetota bacterium]